MTAAWRHRWSARASAPYAIAILSTLLFVWTHRHALQMPGIAEDMGLVQSLSNAAANGTLLGEILPRVLGPLWGPGSTMWRPWAFASLAVDAWLYGSAPGMWHLTNLILHFAAAVFTALLAGAWLRSPWATAAAYATMLLQPWSAEITMWLVGRFDGWATAAIAASLYFSWRSAGLDRWLALTAMFSAIAYLSKESALILLPATAMLLLARHFAQTASEPHWINTTRIVPLGRACAQYAKAAWPLLVLQLLMFMAYLALRWVTVGTLSTNVYGGSQVLSGGELLTRLHAHARAFISIAYEAPFAATVASAFAILTVAGCAIARHRSVLLFAAAWVSIVFIGAALHFRAMVGVGDGYRLYYLAVLAAALCVASGVAAGSQKAPRLTSTLLIIGCVSLAAWQNAANQQWWLAAKEIKATTRAIEIELAKLASTDYAIVLLEDPIGHVPAFRNAQGAVIRTATQRQPGTDGVDFMAAFMPSQLDEWHQLMHEDVVKMITKRSDAPPRPTRFYCKARGETTLQYLGVWRPDNLSDWRHEWIVATQKSCPNLKL